MLLHGFGERAEDDPHLGQLGLEGGGDGDAVKHGIDGDTPARISRSLQRDAQLLVGLEQFGVDLVQALGPSAFCFGAE